MFLFIWRALKLKWNLFLKYIYFLWKYISFVKIYFIFHKYWDNPNPDLKSRSYLTENQRKTVGVNQSLCSQRDWRIESEVKVISWIQTKQTFERKGSKIQSSFRTEMNFSKNTINFSIKTNKELNSVNNRKDNERQWESVRVGELWVYFQSIIHSKRMICLTLGFILM